MIYAIPVLVLYNSLFFHCGDIKDVLAKQVGHLIAGFSLIVSPYAVAEFYAGAAVGASSIDESESFEDEGERVTFTIDDSDTGFKIFGGYSFTPNIAVEGSYVNLGEFQADATGILSGTATGSAEADGYTVEAVGTLPLGNNFSVYGKVGAFIWDSETSLTFLGENIDSSDDGTDETYGLGLAYAFPGTRFGLQGEWQRYDVDGDAVDLYSAGVVLRLP